MSRDQRRRAWWITLAAVVLATATIARTHAAPVYDQVWLLSLPGEIPPFEGGMSSRLLAIAAPAVSPDDAAIENTVVRVTAAALVIGAVSGAIAAAGAPFWLWLLAFATFMTSGVPWLEPTPDVVAIAGVALVCWCAYSRASAVAWMLAVLVLVFSRPDLFLPGLAIGITAAAGTQRRLLRVAVLSLACLVILAVSLRSPQHSFQRATLSFGQHYGLLMYGDTDAKAFDNWRQYLDADFGPDASVRDAMRDNPDKYRAFIRRSLSHTLTEGIGHAASLLYVLAAWAAWRLRREALTWGAGAFVLLSITAITMFAFMHQRYLFRFDALALVLITRAAGRAPSSSWFVRATAIAMLVLIAWHLPNVFERIASGIFRPD